MPGLFLLSYRVVPCRSNSVKADNKRILLKLIVGDPQFMIYLFEESIFLFIALTLDESHA